MTDRKQSPLTLRDVCRAICRHKWRAGAFFVVSMVAATLYCVLSPRTYDSKGKLFVRLGRENATLDPAATLGQEPVVVVPNSRENEINTVVEMLASRPTIENVVSTLGAATLLDEEDYMAAADGATVSHPWLQESQANVATWITDAMAWIDQFSPNPSPPPSTHDNAILVVSENLNVYSVTDSSIINISYESHSPELSQAVVSAVISFYPDRHGQLNRSDGAHAFFARQKADVLEDLTRTENELRDLRNQTGPVSLDGQRAVVVARIARLEDELARSKSDIAVTEAKVRILREKLAAAPPTEVTAHTSGIGNQGTNDIRAQFYAMQIQMQEAAAKYKEVHPHMRRLREQAAAVRKILEAESSTRTHVTEGPGEIHQEAESILLAEEPLLASLRAKNQVLGIQLATANAQWNRLNENDLMTAKLQRDLELHEADYRKYATSFEQTRVDEALQQESISNINVLQQATYTAKPIRPRKFLIVAFGFLIGLFGGVGLALLADKRDRPFVSSEEVETDLDLPTLTSIPRLKRRDLILNGRN